MINVTDFTGGSVQEAGLFEELMRSIKAQLQVEYSADRIKGTNYANVYLGSMTAAMQFASQFVLTKETTNQQILLMQEQITGQQKQNDLINAQILKLTADTAISVKQLEMLDEQVALTVQQTAKTTQEIAEVAKQVEIGTKNLLVMESQILQSTAQTSMIEQQEKNVLAENANIAKTGLQLDANVAILSQKALTEAAQTTGTSDTIGGILGTQMALYDKQKDGYDRDAEQKAAKIYADFYSVTQSVLGAVKPEDYGANGSNVVAVLDQMRLGIGINPSNVIANQE